VIVWAALVDQISPQQHGLLTAVGEVIIGHQVARVTLGRANQSR
jgi:hypothetical protein